MVVKSETKEDVFEKEFSYSLGVDGFSTWDENYPLQKTMVDHDQERIKLKQGGRSVIKSTDSC